MGWQQYSRRLWLSRANTIYCILMQLLRRCGFADRFSTSGIDSAVSVWREDIFRADVQKGDADILAWPESPF
jgi:hypothetical protein